MKIIVLVAAILLSVVSIYGGFWLFKHVSALEFSAQTTVIQGIVAVGVVFWMYRAFKWMRNRKMKKR